MICDHAEESQRQILGALHTQSVKAIEDKCLHDRRDSREYRSERSQSRGQNHRSGRDRSRSKDRREQRSGRDRSASSTRTSGTRPSRRDGSPHTNKAWRDHREGRRRHREVGRPRSRSQGSASTRSSWTSRGTGRERSRHDSWSTRTSSRTSRSATGEQRCFGCGQYSHIQKDCPSKPKETNKSPAKDRKRSTTPQKGKSGKKEDKPRRKARQVELDDDASDQQEGAKNSDSTSL